jgi:hypothetical protein
VGLGTWWAHGVDEPARIVEPQGRPAAFRNTSPVAGLTRSPQITMPIPLRERPPHCESFQPLPPRFGENPDGFHPIGSSQPGTTTPAHSPPLAAPPPECSHTPSWKRRCPPRPRMRAAPFSRGDSLRGNPVRSRIDTALATVFCPPTIKRDDHVVDVLIALARVGSPGVLAYGPERSVLLRGGRVSSSRLGRSPS